MANFRVIPIPGEISEPARAEVRSPQYGHPAHLETATGYGPCRSCLRQFHIGAERRLLFTYNPFAGIDDYPAPGPIFIHEEACSPFDNDAMFPGRVGPGRWLAAREHPAESQIEAAIDRLFGNPAVKNIHVRNTEAGCFIAQINRIASGTPQTAL